MKRIIHFYQIMRNELHKNSHFRRLLFSYILISCITFIIFSMAILGVMQKQHREDMEDINRKNIEQAYSFNNSVLQDISTYCYTALNSVAVRNLIYSDKYDIVTAIASRETYANIQKISSTILSVDFINYATDTVLTKTGRYNLEKFADQELLALLQTLTPRSTPYFCYPREIPYNNESYTETRRVISMIYYSYSNGALVVNLDYDTYYSMLNFDSGNDNFQMYLINMDGKVMASTDNSQFMSDFQSSPLYRKIQESDATKGTFTYSDSTGKYSVAYHKATPMGITYLSLFALEESLQGSGIFTLTLRSSILYLLITLSASLLSSYFIYKPIIKLKKTIHTSNYNVNNNEHSHKNDFDYLESVYQNLMEDSSTLNKIKQNYAEEKIQKLLLTLITDKGNYSISQQDMELLDYYFKYTNYLVFTINIKTDATNLDSQRDMALYKFMIQNVINELFEPHTQLKYVDADFSDLVFVGSFKEYDKDLLHKIVLQAQTFFHKSGLFQCSVGFGSPVTDLENLSNAYSTSKIALLNGYLKDAKCIQFYDDLTLIAPSHQQYPYEAEQDILAALKSLNLENCYSAVQYFFSLIENYHCEQIRHILLRLDTTLQRFEYTNELPVSSSELIWDSNSLFTWEDLKNIFSEHCKNDILALTEIKMHSFAKTELISNVNAFIEDNIYNPNLSVALIAEKVDLSINYLRNIYKENTGESLTTYIANRKLSIVCEMLSDTNISIQDISDKLGFTTKNYFFTFFKKHMDMTPTQYRSMHQTK